MASSSAEKRSRCPVGRVDCVPEEPSLPEGADPPDWPEGMVTETNLDGGPESSYNDRRRSPTAVLKEWMAPRKRDDIG